VLKVVSTHPQTSFCLCSRLAHLLKNWWLGTNCVGELYDKRQAPATAAVLFLGKPDKDIHSVATAFDGDLRLSMGCDTRFPSGKNPLFGTSDQLPADYFRFSNL